MSDGTFDIHIGGSGDTAFLIECNVAMAWETEAKCLDMKTVEHGVLAVIDNPSHGFYLVAQHQGKQAACLMITTEWSDWRAGDFWWIQSVFVKKEYRRKGIYRKLFEEVQRRAAISGDVCGIRLYVEKENLKAKKTYESLGMKETHYLLYERAISD